MTGTRRGRRARLEVVTTLRTACPLDCPDACTLDVTVTDGRLVAVDAAPTGDGNPLTQGYICQKVKHHAKRVYAPERIMTPLIRTGAKGAGLFREATWDEAIDIIADRMRAVISTAGPDAVFPYLYNSSGGFAAANGITEGLFKALGCPHIAHTICASTAGHAYAQVFDAMLSADAMDLPHSRVIVVWGANPQVANTHMLPLLTQAKKDGARLIVIDPRRTGVAGRADLHLAVKPGTDVLLAFAAVLRLQETGKLNEQFIARHVEGAAEFLAAAAKTVPSIDAAIVECGISSAEFDTFVALISGPDGPAMLRMGWGLERNRNGGSSIIAAYGLWALLGHFGTLGSGVIASQGRATKYTAAKVTEAFQQATAVAGDLVATGERKTFSMNQVGAALCDRIEGWAAPQILFVQGANPAVTSVDQATMLSGLARHDLFTVVHEQVMTDTATFADVILPATTHFEADDLASSYGSFTMQPIDQVINRVGQSRTNDEVGAALAERLGFGQIDIQRADYVTDGDVDSRVTRAPGETIQSSHSRSRRDHSVGSHPPPSRSHPALRSRLHAANANI
jgi:anaerobic selenocysteine-containing dehydrogenase